MVARASTSDVAGLRHDRFFAGLELMAMLCSNTSENSRMNSTKMAINKPSEEKQQEEEQRKRLLAMRRRGRSRAQKEDEAAGQQADAMGIRNVKTVGQKAIQLLEFRVTAFLGSIDMARVRAMLLLLDDLERGSFGTESGDGGEDE